MLVHNRSHLLAAAVVSEGPSQNSPQFPEAIWQASVHLPIDQLLVDASYDGEHNHQLARQVLGIRSTVIALNRRNTRKWPTGRYRRQMKRRFPRCVYRQRSCVESAISQHKRRLGPARRACLSHSQATESLMRVLTHNLMILR